MSDAIEPKTRRKRHWFVRVLRALGVLAVAAVIVYLIADQIAYQKLERKKDAFREQFGKVDYQEFVPARPVADEDAGRVYRYAVGLMDEVEKELGDWSAFDALTKGGVAFEERGGRNTTQPSPEEIDGLVLEKLQAMGPAFRAVEEARLLEPVSMLEGYEIDEFMPGLMEVRQLARNVGAKAVYEARAGNLDAACAWLESGMHVACTLDSDPTLMILMVRDVVTELAVRSAQEVFNSTDATLPLGDRYWTLLDRVADPAAYANSLAGEAGFMLAQEMPAPRLYWSLNMVKTLDLIMEVVGIVQQEPSSARRSAMKALAQESENMSELYMLTKMTAPTVLVSADAYDAIAVRCDSIRIATALREYKVAHGAYPESLESIAATYPAPLPVDPFSGGPLHYRVEGAGFVLYSVDRDGVDDGGTDGRRNKGDLVWPATR